MKTVVPAICFALLSSVALGAHAQDIDQTPVFAFVGEQLQIEELPHPCADESASEENGQQVICVAFDALFRATYRVRERLFGEATGPEITFDVADHYGFPGFARSRTALLFVHVTTDGNFLSKYMGFPVFPTADGSWAMCGSPYREDTKAIDQRLLPITFADGVVFGDVSTLSPAAVKEQFDPADYAVVGTKVYCRRGVYVEDLFDWVAKGTMRARGIDLGTGSLEPEEPSPMAD